VLPLGPTGFGDSPYASPSAFAGNPLLLSPDLESATRRQFGSDPFQSTAYDVVEPDEVEPPLAAFVSGRAGLACVRLRLGNDTFVECGTDEQVAAALAGRLGAGATLACAGAPEGVLARLGERGIIVRPCSPSPSPPALALARKALQRTPAANPHAVRADYGSVAYYTRREVPRA